MPAQLRPHAASGAAITTTPNAPAGNTAGPRVPKGPSHRSTLLVAFPVFGVAVLFAVVLSYSSMAALRFAAEDMWCQLRETAHLDPKAEALLDQYATLFGDKAAGSGSGPPDAWRPELFSVGHNASLHWGTYRPGVLMGIRSRSDASLLFGVAWFDTARSHDVRHLAVDSTSLVFKWVVHDGRYFGRQDIIDLENGIRLEILFIKHPNNLDWAVRVTSARLDGFAARHSSITVAVYFANDAGPQYPVHITHVQPHGDGPDALPGDPAALEFSGPLKTADAAAGRYVEPNTFRAVASDACANRSSWKVATTTKGAGQAWNIDIRHLVASGTAKLPTAAAGPPKTSGPNVALLHKTYATDFRVEVAFSSRVRASFTGGSDATAPKAAAADGTSSSSPSQQLQAPPFFRFTSCEITSAAKHLERRFHSDFARRFPFASLGGVSTANSVLVAMAEAALSNMIGGLGYWVGNHRVVRWEVDDKADKQGRDLLPVELAQLPLNPPGPTTFDMPQLFRLFSGVPSRAKFPRGFLWDEGFHQLLIGKWDKQVSYDVLSHWIVGAKTDFAAALGGGGKSGPGGWIPREQILGEEARTRIPSEFLAQHPTHANPPSFILQIQNFANAASSDEDFAFLRALIPHLRQWRDWYHTSQCGGWVTDTMCHTARVPLSSAKFNVTKELMYRWRSKNNFHLLASGLDDYPRFVCKNVHRRALHLDMYCWMWLLTHTLADIERKVSAAGGWSAPSCSSSSSSSNNAAPSKAEKGQDWDAAAAAPPLSSKSCDASRVTEEQWHAQMDFLHYNAEQKLYYDVSGCTHPGTYSDPLYFSKYEGYVNLFPVLTMVLNDRQKALETLRFAQRKLAMGGFGLQSITNHSRQHLANSKHQHEDYWTGPIWININFMFLRALKLKYNGMLGEPTVKLYDTVRRDLIQNLAKEYQRTGNLWENYHWVTGKGQGTAPFTGWSALIVLILAEQY